MDFLYALAGGLCVGLGEYLMRQLRHWHYWQIVPLVFPLFIVVNYSIWRILQNNSIVGGVILISTVTAGTRIVATLVSGDIIEPKVWIAFGLVVIAAVIKSL